MGFHIDKDTWDIAMELFRRRRYGDFENIIDRYEDLILSDGGKLDQQSRNQAVEYVDEFLSAQERISSHTGPILVSSMQKSGSVFFVYMLSKILGIPVCSIARHPDFGDPDEYILGKCLSTFSRSSAITHEHFRASAHNVGLINRSSIDKIIVQMRDPRDALVSMCYFSAGKVGNKRDAARKICDEIFDKLFKYLVAYVESWFSSLKNGEIKKDVCFIFFNELIESPAEEFSRALNFLELSRYSELARGSVLEHANDPGVYNFRSGKTGEWRNFLTESEKRLCSSAIERLIDGYASLPPAAAWLNGLAAPPSP